MARAEAVWACRALAVASYASGGWSVGAVALVAGWLARTRPPAPGSRRSSPTGPQRYFDTVYNDDYCRAHGLLGAAAAARPGRDRAPGRGRRRALDPLHAPSSTP